MDRYEGDDDTQVVVDTHTFDCADFFCAAVTREFPDVQAQVTFPLAWRPSWVFTVGPHEEISKLDQLCFDMQQRIFWEQNVLIGYTIQKEEVYGDAADNSSGL